MKTLMYNKESYNSYTLDLSSKVCKIFVFFGGRVIRPPFLCISVSQMEVPMNRLKKNA